MNIVLKVENLGGGGVGDCCFVCMESENIQPLIS